MGVFLTLLLIVCLIGLVVAMARMKASPETAKPAAIGLAVLTVVLVIVRMAVGGGKDSGEVIEDLTAAAGYVVAQRVAAEVPAPARVVLIAPTAASEENPQSVKAGTVRGVMAALKDSEHVFEVFPIDQGRVSMGVYPYVSGDILQEVAAAHPEAGAYVFLQCIPGPTKARIEAPFYGIGVSTPETNQGTLPKGFSAVATYRKDADWKTKPGMGMSPEKIFALRYRMLPE